MRSKPSEITRGRRGERGAALVMSLLVAMLLLAAGGALIATAGMTVSNAVDATAESQAYYAADAGLQAALTVVRRNRAVRSGVTAMPSNFHTFACGTAAACTNAGNDLSQWLTYAGNGRVTLSTSPDLSYTVRVTDPSLSATANLAASYVPRFLHVQSVGRGPRGSVKVLEMMVDDFGFDFTARAAVALHSNDTDTTAMTTFSIGQSAPHLWNGNDLAGQVAGLPAFAVTNSADYDGGDGLNTGTLGKAERVISNDGANVIGAAQLKKLTNADLEWWLKDATSARLFLTQMRAKAAQMGRVNPSDYGSDSNPQFSFVDGDVDLVGGSSDGAGLMIVTGTYHQGGSAQFKGIVLALGNGVVDRNGNPDTYGAMVVAKFQHDWNSTTQSYTGTGGFASPSLTTAGGGNSLVGYDSVWVRRAMESLGSRVVGMVEK
jgi:Tfp pilus assembly protein PilX